MASDMRALVVAHDNAQQQVSALDSQLTDLGQQSFSAASGPSSVHSLRLMLRVSVTEGVREMYEQYCSRKRQAAQQTAAERHAGQHPLTLELPVASVRRSDKTVGRLSISECEFYRGS